VALGAGDVAGVAAEDDGGHGAVGSRALRADEPDERLDGGLGVAQLAEGLGEGHLAGRAGAGDALLERGQRLLAELGELALRRPDVVGGRAPQLADDLADLAVDVLRRR